MTQYKDFLGSPDFSRKGEPKGRNDLDTVPFGFDAEKPHPQPLPLPEREGLGVGSSPVTVSSRDLLLGCFPAKVGRAIFWQARHSKIAKFLVTTQPIK